MTAVSLNADGSATIIDQSTGQRRHLTAEAVRVAQSAGDFAEKATQRSAEAQMAAERYAIAAGSRSPVSSAQSAFASPHRGVRFLSPQGFPIGVDQVDESSIIDRGPGLGQWSLGSLLATGEATRNEDGSVTIHDAVEPE